MHHYFQHLKLAAKRFVWILILYSFCRLFFYLLNSEYFTGSSFFSIINSFIAGIRFDIAAIVFTNFIFIILLLPGSFKDNHAVQKAGSILFFTINGVAILLNLIDARFFDFINKRSTSALFILMTSNSDVWTVLPGIIKDYWYIAVLWILVMILFWIRLPQLSQSTKEKLTLNNFILQIFVFLGIIALLLLGGRGTGLKPIGITDAASVNGPKHIPLVLNSTISLLKTAGNENLQEVVWFSEDTLQNIFQPVHESQTENDFKKINVVIFILESFSKEYSGYLDGSKGYTPNLDSLLKRSLVFPNAFANGTQSYEAMPAIIAGIPSLMDRPYSGSNYADNYIEGLPELLKRQGYSTWFFHGGNNGTMGFDNFARIAGIENYMGREEYGNEADYDGYWGIWDEPYLKYFASKISELPQPFFASVFTLSSHHPYNVPTVYRSRFREGSLPILKSIEYTDFTIGEFFRIARKLPWFNNTLFIFTADHAAQAIESSYNNTTGMFAIPLALYNPSDKLLIGIDSSVCQQIDIMPTILNYLHYPDDYFAFGESLLNNQSNHRCISYTNGIYQLIEKNHVMQFDGEKVVSYFTISGMPMPAKDSATDQEYIGMENTLRAFIQTYNYCLIHNSTYLDRNKTAVSKVFSNSDKNN
jgi:phosphoglycerol transferase MdoB-like AlkP superfamily enzyme